ANGGGGGGGGAGGGTMPSTDSGDGTVGDGPASGGTGGMPHGSPGGEGAAGHAGSFLAAKPRSRVPKQCGGGDRGFGPVLPHQPPCPRPSHRRSRASPPVAVSPPRPQGSFPPLPALLREPDAVRGPAAPGSLGYAGPPMTELAAPPPAWENPAFVAVRCFACGEPHDRHTLLTVCRLCGLPLRVDHDHTRAPLPPSALPGRPASLWRYREVLPIRPEHAVSLVEGWTPLCPVSDRLCVKDEPPHPTGSFKAPGIALAVSMARAPGARALSAPSAGNAAGALAAYGAAARLPVVVAMPEDTPRAFVDEC